MANTKHNKICAQVCEKYIDVLHVKYATTLFAEITKQCVSFEIVLKNWQATRKKYQARLNK